MDVFFNHLGVNRQSSEIHKEELKARCAICTMSAVICLNTPNFGSVEMPFTVQLTHTCPYSLCFALVTDNSDLPLI